MNTRSVGRFGFGLALLGLVGLGTAGCKLECSCSGKNEVKEVVDEVGDEIEDVVEKVKKDDK